MPDPQLPSFDLVLATVDRTDELDGFLGSLDRQTHKAFRLLVADQNADDRVGDVLGRHPGLTVEHLRAERGLARARNAALPSLSADIVAFPDDDCVYPPDLLDRIARRFASNASVDGLTGRGGGSSSWKHDAAILTRDNLWNRAISYAIFLRREVVSRVGRFDEELGLGSGQPWSSGEEIDYLIRAVDAGARIEYDPDLVVGHPERSYSADSWHAVGARDGASVGYLLRKHRYSPRRVAPMFARPVVGAALAGLGRNRTPAGFHLATLRGRLRGYLRSPVE